MKTKKKKEKLLTERKGLRIAKRWKKGFFYIVFSRLGFIIFLLLIQCLLLLMIWGFFGQLMTQYMIGGQTIFEIIVLLILFNSGMDSTAKLSWTLLIAIVPLFGCIFYLWTHVEMGHRTIKQKLNLLTEKSKKYLSPHKEAYKHLKAQSESTAGMSRYLFEIAHCPVYENTSVEYFPLGEYKFPKMLEEIEKAEKFIFLEYFIIEEGHMWGNILEQLARKAKCGVDVRVMYDGTCEFTTLPYYYPKMLGRLGIKCQMWEPIKPVVTSSYNYRDHRKILVIDGKTAFCGGINLADEYINRVKRFGHWKDTAIMLKGAAVDSFTLMFLQMWNVKKKETDDFSRYFGLYDRDIRTNGFVQPYCESPLNDHKVAERVYMDILYSAKKYVYITTPYLILDDELMTALRYTAERGVDVRIIMPGIPDKKAVWALSKKHYKPLISAGVKIYEYTPGFIHAKTFISDDQKAVVGTINLDYRSLYHHFECAAFLFETDCIKDIKKDVKYCLDHSKRIRMEDIRKENIVLKAVGTVLKPIAPLL